MKKIVAIMLAAGMTLGLVACGAQETPESEQVVETEETTDETTEETVEVVEETKAAPELSKLDVELADGENVFGDFIYKVDCDYDNNRVVVNRKSFEGEELESFYVELEAEDFSADYVHAWSFTIKDKLVICPFYCPATSRDDGKGGTYTAENGMKVTTASGRDVCDGFVMDETGKIVSQFEIARGLFDDGYYGLNVNTTSQNLAIGIDEYEAIGVDEFADIPSTVNVGMLDLQDWSFSSDSEVLKAKNYPSDPEHEQYARCFDYDFVSNAYLASTDGSEWGYVSADGEEIAMYADASNFTANGYAAVSEDGETYDIIDKDFNVVIESAFQASGAHTMGSGGNNIICATDAEGNEILYLIEE